MKVLDYFLCSGLYRRQVRSCHHQIRLGWLINDTFGRVFVRSEDL